MTYETYGKDEVYVFDGITPGTYTLNHTYGVGIWGPQQLTADQLIGTDTTKPTVTALDLTQFGNGSTQWGTVEVRVYPGPTSGRIEVTFHYTEHRVDQAITFEPLTDKLVGAPPFRVSATASSGLPVRYSALGSCTVSDDTVTLTGPGTCTITASQSGDAEGYYPARDVSRSFQVVGASQQGSVGAPGPTPPGIDRRIAIKRATLRVDRKRHVKVQILCGPTAGTRCRGVVQVLWTGKRLLARRSFSIGAGTYHSVTLTVTKERYRQLRKHKSLHVTVVLLTRGSDGVLRRAEQSKVRIYRT